MTEEKVKKLLDNIRPGIQMDGGDVEFVEIREGVVYVRLVGACGGCPMAQLTLKEGIERYIRNQMPEIKSVEAV
ncbi:MAG: NifU family protein [Calditrichaeota bacterium]|nr:NifU family protein [Calditrichota bacterium]